MNPLFSAAAEVQQWCEGLGWSFCFIGGLTTIRWGEPRLTANVDVTTLAGFGRERPVVDRLLERFDPRLEGARAFALENRVVLIRAGNGIPVDVALGGLDFEDGMVEPAVYSNEVGEREPKQHCRDGKLGIGHRRLRALTSQGSKL